MSTTTTNYGLIKPDTTDPILIGQLNDNADIIDATLKSLSDALDVAKLGIKYKGEVNYYSNLPSSGNQIGDAYTVKYAGSSGTTPDGTEYVWGTVSGTNQWINFSKDSYTKAEVDALLALKQNALTTAQLAAVNSGIDSTKVAQIETNKNNILSLEQMNGAKNLAKLSYTGSTVNNVTYTVSEGVISTNGNTTNAITSIDITSNISLKAGTYYLLDGQLSSSGDNNITLYINGNWSGSTTSGVKEFNLNFDGYVKLALYIGANINTTNMIFKPMLLTKTAYDAGFTDYQPYALSNAELTAKRQTRRLGQWVTSFTVETPPFGTGTIVKVYIYKGAPDKGLSEYILASESVSLVCGGDGVSYSISGSIVTFTTTSTCIAYAETLRFDV